MNEITSLTNNYVKELVKLKNNKDKEVFLVENEHLVNEALNLNLVKEIITTENIQINNIKTTKVTKEIMKKISNLENPQNIIAVVKKTNPREILGNVIILDKLQDPGNLGTIIRSAIAFNIDTLVLGDGCVDVYNSKVIQASQGMIFKINIIKDNLNNIIPDLKNKDYKIIGTKLIDGVEISNVKKLNKFAFVIGNEGQGISKEVLNQCDDYVYIKMNEQCESLNAGVAASIIMYELTKE